MRAMLTGFTAVALVATITVGAVSLWGQRMAAGAAQQSFVSKDVTADILPPPMYLIEMRLVLSQAIEGSLPVDQAQKEFERLKGEYQARVDYWRENPPYGLESGLLGPQHVAAQAFVVSAGALLEKVRSQAETSAVRNALSAAHADYMAHRAGVDSTVLASSAFAEASMKRFQDNGAAMLLGQGLLIGIAALLLVVCGIWIRHSIWRAVGGEPADAAAVAKRVAAGDLSLPVPVAEGDKDSVMAALGQMSGALSGIVTQVRWSSDSVATGSGQIAQGNNDLSVRTEQQASAIQETAAAMDELSSTLSNNADNAKRANQLALGASVVAVKGGEVMVQVVETMKGINDSSKRIADIIGVIDGIAFQTNILALNAAVEAARAGEQGRGFAVVASEVRNLAQRSAAAAKEIKSLITVSVDSVGQGTALVDRAGTTMQEIVTSIRRVTDIMGEITEASIEQSAGIVQVGSAVKEMDQITQQNAALVEESAAAAESLREQAQRLVKSVAVFKVDDVEAGDSALAAASDGSAVERRGPDRARNVSRPVFSGKKVAPPAARPQATARAPAAAAAVMAAVAPAVLATGTDGDWTTF